MSVKVDGTNSIVSGYQALLSRNMLSKSVAGAVDVALSATELENLFFELTGVLTGNINVTCGTPVAGQEALVLNNTTGAFTLTWKGSSGTGVLLLHGRVMHLYCDGTNWLPVISPRQVVNMAADANKTLTNSEFNSDILEITSVALGATRDIIVPLDAGRQITLFNNTTGGQSIRIISPSGTGITVANGKRAIVYCDGTNWVRVTADT